MTVGLEPRTAPLEPSEVEKAVGHQSCDGHAQARVEGRAYPDDL